MSIYDPTIFYIYAYLREDGTPYYIGKGKDNRAWAHHRGCGVRPPKDTSRVVIMESNLTEVGALALERFYIRWYGRKDNGTGILRNLTDGGDGVAGIVMTEETRKRMSRSRKGMRHSEKTREKISQRCRGVSKPYRQLSEDTKSKISETMKRRECTSMLGKNHSDESRRLMSEKGKGKIFANNGTKNIKCYPHEIPNGYVQGRLRQPDAPRI